MPTAVSRTVVAASFAIVCSAPLPGRQRPAVTADDYARAERFLAPAVTPLVVGGSVAATWLPDDRFWYRNTIPGGPEFVIVDPARKIRARAFDHEKVAAALSSVGGAKVDPFNSAIQARYAAAGPYMMRRRLDYFVTWLIGAQPPR